MLVAVVVPMFSAPAANVSRYTPVPSLTGPPAKVAPLAPAVVMTRPFVASVDVMVSAVNVSDAYAGMALTDKKSIAEMNSTILFRANKVVNFFIKKYSMARGHIKKITFLKIG